MFISKEVKFLTSSPISNVNYYRRQNWHKFTEHCVSWTKSSLLKEKGVGVRVSAVMVKGRGTPLHCEGLNI